MRCRAGRRAGRQDLVASPTPSKRETERKYETDEPIPLPGPARLLRSTDGGPQPRRLEATYHDTADLGLLRAKITLRHRAGGHDAGWHPKLPAGADGREEIQLRLNTPQVPEQLVELTRIPAHRQPLIAQLVEDDVHAHTLEAQTSALAGREVEVEVGEHAHREPGRTELGGAATPSAQPVSPEAPNSVPLIFSDLVDSTVGRAS